MSILKFNNKLQTCKNAYQNSLLYFNITLKNTLPLHVGIGCDHVESAVHSIEFTPVIRKPQAHLNTPRFPYVSLYSTMINLESSTLIGGHLTMMHSGGKFDQSPTNIHQQIIIVIIIQLIFNFKF